MTATTTKKAVLIVDDSATMRASLEFMLREGGYPVLVAESGPKALKLLEEFPAGGGGLGMIITDVNMPEMDGIAFVREVKHTTFRFTPIIVLTTESEAEKKNRGREAGVSGWMIKPFGPQELLAVVAKLSS